MVEVAVIMVVEVVVAVVKGELDKRWSDQLLSQSGSDLKRRQFADGNWIWDREKKKEIANSRKAFLAKKKGKCSQVRIVPFSG